MASDVSRIFHSARGWFGYERIFYIYSPFFTEIFAKTGQNTKKIGLESMKRGMKRPFPLSRRLKLPLLMATRNTTKKLIQCLFIYVWGKCRHRSGILCVRTNSWQHEPCHRCLSTTEFRLSFEPVQMWLWTRIDSKSSIKILILQTTFSISWVSLAATNSLSLSILTGSRK